MKRCPTCRTWHPNDYRFCPDCRTELERNEMSSEDADDGVFTESKTCDRCGCTLTAVNSAPAIREADSDWEFYCRDCFDVIIDEQIEANRQERKERRKSRESDDDMHGVNPS